MSKKISANLDLTQSLLDFQYLVTKLLELNNVQEWDAKIIQLREQEIRSAALILGQRIDTNATWEQLVLPEKQKQILQNMVTHVRQRLKVYEKWGFASISI